MKIKLIIAFIALNYAAITAAKTIVLNEKPISVSLPVNNETIVKFPNAVTHTNNVSSTNNDKFSTFLTPDGVLYLTATEPFDKTRLVAEMVNGKVVLLDLKSSVGAVKQDITIVTKPPKTVSKRVNKRPTRNPNKPAFLKDRHAKTKRAKTTNQQTSANYSEMVQFAFRHFTGPSRLVGKQKAVRRRVSFKNLSRFVRVWQKSLSIKPLAQWQFGNGQYVTVLLVNNKSSNSIQFDPRALRGRLIFAASLHPVIEPQGEIRDQTLWGIVTSVPFNRAIKI